MPLSDPRNLFGIHSILFYRRDNRKPYGKILKVLANSNINLAADFEDLTGGSERYIIASEPKNITPEFAVTSKEYPDYLYELFTGATVVQNAAEATGNVGALSNVSGTTVFDATTGIASVAATAADEGDLKFAKYVAVATGANTVNILASSDIDFARGNDAAYQNDDLEVLAADITIPSTGGTVAVPELGLTFTGGSGTVAFTTDDTAKFDVRPINNGSSIISIGASTGEFPEFGAICYAQKRGSGEMFEIEMFRCIGAGLPMPLEEKVFAQAEITIKPLKDFALDKVMEIRAIK